MIRTILSLTQKAHIVLLQELGLDQMDYYTLKDSLPAPKYKILHNNKKRNTAGTAIVVTEAANKIYNTEVIMLPKELEGYVQLVRFTPKMGDS